MQTLHYLEQFASSLSKEGLPRRYVERAIDEMRDHCEDDALSRDKRASALKNETANEAANSATDNCSQLGEIQQLSKHFAANYRRRSFAGRHPILTVIVAPYFAAHICVIGYYVLLVLFGVFVVPLFGLDLENTTTLRSGIDTLAYDFMNTAHRLGTIFPFVFTMWLAARAAISAGRGWRWLLAGCTLQCVLGASCISKLILPVNGGNDPELTIGMMPFYEWTDPICWPQQCCNAIVIGLIAYVFWNKSFRELKPAQYAT